MGKSRRRGGPILAVAALHGAAHELVRAKCGVRERHSGAEEVRKCSERLCAILYIHQRIAIIYYLQIRLSSCLRQRRPRLQSLR